MGWTRLLRQGGLWSGDIIHRELVKFSPSRWSHRQKHCMVHFCYISKGMALPQMKLSNSIGINFSHIKFVPVRMKEQLLHAKRWSKILFKFSISSVLYTLLFNAAFSCHSQRPSATFLSHSLTKPGCQNSVFHSELLHLMCTSRPVIK